MNKVVYDDDLFAWTEEQAALLRAGDLSALDLPNLAEEIESLGRSQRREVTSRLAVLVQHLLKWRYQPTRRSPSWRATIRTQRRDLREVLNDNPSLRRRLPDLLEKAYPDAVDRTRDETGLIRLPDACPFTLEQLLELTWLPD